MADTKPPEEEPTPCTCRFDNLVQVSHECYYHGSRRRELAELREQLKTAEAELDEWKASDAESKEINREFRRQLDEARECLRMLFAKWKRAEAFPLPSDFVDRIRKALGEI